MKGKFFNGIYAVKILALCITFCGIVIMEGWVYNKILRKNYVEAFLEVELPEIIIDAGHGGKDGGAVSEGGIEEKHLNLSVANSLNDILRLCGVSTVMTREVDELVCDENDPDLKGKLKITDLKNRLQIANAHPNAYFVSIHMNIFSIEKYNGLQVYYSPNNEKSLIIAKNIQESVCKVLQPQNNRKVKKAGSSIFLLDRLRLPAVLIECGFLSNSTEAELLATPSYQTSLSLLFAASLLSNFV